LGPPLLARAVEAAFFGAALAAAFFGAAFFDAAFFGAAFATVFFAAAFFGAGFLVVFADGFFAIVTSSSASSSVVGTPTAERPSAADLSYEADDVVRIKVERRQRETRLSRITDGLSPEKTAQKHVCR
jgi:hypothetical protein